MIRTNLRPSVLLYLCVLCLPLSAFASQVRGKFQRTLQVSGPAQLEIDTGSWDVSVHNGPPGAITVSGKIYVDNRWLFGERTAQVEELEKNPPIHLEGNTLHVDRADLHNMWIDYEITVPAETSVHSHTGSGDLKISGLHGDLKLESGSGDLVLDHITGTVKTQSGSGDVRAEAISGPFSAEASSGDIRLEEEAKGDVEIHTGSGNIEATGVNGALRVEAGSGDVSLDGSPAGNWQAHTGSGNLTLHLDSHSAFHLDASTNSGDLHVGRAVTITVQGNLDAMRHAIKGTVGSGGPMVTAHTGSGDLNID
jgi:hypothetical protein